MDDFSIERAATEIPDPRTRRLFKEVQTCYANRCLRSALVMLWSVVICDLIWKLEDLRDIEDDSIAKKILAEIREAQDRDPRSPAWEAKLLDAVTRRTHLLEPANLQALEHLKELRHLSAHAILTEESLLHQPNGDTVRACIREALEGLLLKPPIFTKEVISAFLLDLSARKEILINEAYVERYITAKYFPRLSPALENTLFRSLWKLCFRTENVKTDANRAINVLALQVLSRRRPSEVATYILENRDFFSEISEKEPLRFLVQFLARFPQFYTALTDAAKAIIEGACTKDNQLRAIAWFLGRSPEAYLKSLEELAPSGDRIDETTWAVMLDLGDRSDLRPWVLRVGILQYTSSESFDMADYCWEAFVEPHLSEYSRDQLELLLEGIEKNSQTFRRRRSKAGHGKLLKRWREVFGDPPREDLYTQFYDALAD